MAIMLYSEKVFTCGGTGLKTLKILVAGHFGAGKTTFVKTASEIKALTTERKTSHPEEKKRKDYTTVSMDYGELTWEETKLAVFGIPGQERFSFMWKILSRGTDGYIFMLDSTDTSLWEETVKQVNMFLSYGEVPYLICANKQDLEEALPLQEIRKRLSLDRRYRLVPCIAHDPEVVRNVLWTLVEEIKRAGEKASVNPEDRL